MPQQRLHIAVITIHTPHYENVPFEIPEGWAWTTLGDLLNMQAGKNISANEIQSEKNEQTKYACYGGNGVRGFVTDYNTTGKHAIIGRQGALCGNINVAEGCFYATEHTVVVDVFGGTDTDWCIYMLEQLNLNQYATATAQPGLSVNKIAEVLVPVPPQAEQKRISQVIQKWLNTLALIEGNKTTLNAAIINAKSKILDLAIHGKLVPQDPNDEPAIELLKRINPDFTPCDNGHYPNLPKGWAVCKLEDIVDYEQPTAYIVASTNYDDDFSTPVLTAGKSFVIGYTNEMNGIYSNLPCIIFDDFTTDSKLVDFPFKVKSSAMKILQVNKEVEIEYVALFMRITRLIGDTHKRYWISEYSKLPIPIPPHKEQKRIINTVRRISNQLDVITESL